MGRGVYMRRGENSLLAYILIGVGLYFLLKELNIAIFSDYYSWPFLVIIIGVIFLIHSYSTRNNQNLFSSVILLGIGIHFYGLNNYPSWIDHWAVYMFIVGLAFIIRYILSKSGLFIGLVLIGLSIVMIFSINVPAWLNWVYTIPSFIKQFWPIILIILGVYLLINKKGKSKFI